MPVKTSKISQGRPTLATEVLVAYVRSSLFSRFGTNILYPDLTLLKKSILTDPDLKRRQLSSVGDTFGSILLTNGSGATPFNNAL